VELDGQERSVRRELADLGRAIEAAAKPVFVQRGFGHAGCERFWKLRREFSYALRDTGLTKLNEDIVVPRGRLDELFRFTARLQRKYRIPIACFGHAGDGNIHVNVMRNDADSDEVRRSEECLDELFRGILQMDGVITGEHGVGLAKRPWWPTAIPEPGRSLHGLVKRALDPQGLLNPGKFLD
jgi:glycolate oxidase